MEYICLGQLSSGPPPLPLSLLYYINIIQHASLYLTRAKNSILTLQKKGQREKPGRWTAPWPPKESPSNAKVLLPAASSPS